jgi:hypothetical protein
MLRAPLNIGAANHYDGSGTHLDRQVLPRNVTRTGWLELLAIADSGTPRIALG